MAEFIRVAVSSIHIGERLRPIDMDYAEAIAASMSEHGQISPIMIRKTPAKKGTPYTLVAGGYRTTAATLLGWTEIDAIVVKADAVEAQLLEISENLYRNELNPLDRAIFVMKYRELWEEKHGKITRGGDQKSKPQNAGLVFSAGRELSKLVQERLGISQDKYERAVSIGTKLDPVLKQAVRGTTAENDQSQLLTLAKLPREDQIAIAGALKHTRDVKKVLAFTKPPALVATPPAPSQSIILTKLIAAWDEASEETRDSFLEHIGMSNTPDALMAAIREEAA
ncbi:ParB/RepB/Spo0J family partition protein [Agrobacterium sp. S7/73]|uniref:ParB/RepB/Spo0J family partition protein n=1 Tax=Agrobacterium sp. S7/73 TaxID=2820002 RepID=UPI001C5BE0C2|nr:ParB/RepB/Spo0J family partition protein [Agrobacterium sp. S7/73]QXZ71836.1 ParB/RepB/Spo0J family partition protein [Agrobacterium sp. S7/73]QXZ74624.1 ParB/RepB/Spo0J family partition protein [Agrobacterium sp. S7/73]